MKNLLKSILFIAIFIFLYYGFSYALLPKENIKDFGLIKTAQYEILGEKKNSIDAIVVGDSLVYSSVIPMEIYKKFGHTVFDCAEAAFILPDAYDYYKVALESQRPKIVLVGANMFFRDTRKRRWYIKYERMIKNIMPLLNYHNNWKNILFSDYGIMSIQKGYKLNKTQIPSKPKNYMEKNNKKLIVIGFPSQDTWNYQKDQAIKKLSEEYYFTYINLNNYDLNIDWVTDTKDKGGHLNYYGALKASEFVGNILRDTNLLTDHRKDKNYKLWDRALERYEEEIAK